MKAEFHSEITAWLMQAGLAGESENAIVDGFCERCVAAGLPIGRAHVFIDTLHPVHEGRLFRWGHNPNETPLMEYGRTVPVPDSTAEDELAAERWRKSPFYRMLQTGESLLHRKVPLEGETEFAAIAEIREFGMTDYVAIINRFAADGVIGEMDCLYSSWATRNPDGFSDAHIAALQRLTPYFALAIKSVSLVRMTGTLMQTYLGRDAGQRVLSGRIVRGVADRIDAVIWFSDLRGFTRITDTTPEQVIPLLNDYADVIVSAIHEHGGDVLKLIGDGTLAIFSADDRERACNAALAAVIEARQGIAALNERRSALGLAVIDMYLGLHVGEVLYGNVGSTERLDFTVVGPAVNEAAASPRCAAPPTSRCWFRQPLPRSARSGSGWCRLAAMRCAASAGPRSCSRSIRRPALNSG